MSTPDQLVRNQHFDIAGSTEVRQNTSVTFSIYWKYLYFRSVFKIGHVAFICQRLVLLFLFYFFLHLNNVLFSQYVRNKGNLCVCVCARAHWCEWATNSELSRCCYWMLNFLWLILVHLLQYYQIYKDIISILRKIYSWSNQRIL